jgi:hypothetical protein
MMKTIAMHNMTSASMLGQRFFQNGTLALLPEGESPSDRSSDVVAGDGWSSSSSSASVCPWSLLSSRESSGVCSVVRLDCCERTDGDERVDFFEAGRELGVRVEPHVCSGVSIFRRGEFRRKSVYGGFMCWASVDGGRGEG